MKGSVPVFWLVLISLFVIGAAAYLLDPQPKFDPLTVNKMYCERFLRRGEIPDRSLEDRGDHYSVEWIPHEGTLQGNIQVSIRRKELILETHYASMQYSETSTSKTSGTSKGSTMLKIPLPQDSAVWQAAAFYRDGVVITLIPKRKGWEKVMGPFYELFLDWQKHPLELTD